MNVNDSFQNWKNRGLENLAIGIEDSGNKGNGFHSDFGTQIKMNNQEKEECAKLFIQDDFESKLKEIASMDQNNDMDGNSGGTSAGIVGVDDTDVSLFENNNNIDVAKQMSNCKKWKLYTKISNHCYSYPCSHSFSCCL